MSSNSSRLISCNCFALGRQLLVDLEAFSVMDIVGFLRPADEGEIRAGGHTLMAVGIQTRLPA